MKITCTIAIILLLLTGIGISGNVYYPTGASQHINVAQLGMGGLTITNASNAHSLFYNPALINRQEYILEIAPVAAGVNKDFFDVYSFYGDHKDEFEDFEALDLEEQEKFFKDSESFDNKWVGAYLTPYLGYVKGNFGFGLYSVTQLDVKIDQGVFVPSLALRGFSNIVFGVGTGRLVDLKGKSFEVGVTGKLILQSIVEQIHFDATDAGEIDVDTVINDFENDMTSYKFGFGIDAGMIRTLELGGKLDVDCAVVVQDLISVLDGYVAPNVKLGAMAHLPVGSPPNITGWNMGIEIVDLLNRKGINLFQRINLGTEISLFSKYVSLRGGFHQGYPTFGAGLKISIVNLDYAYFSRELGFKPGVTAESTHRIQLAFGF